MTILLGGRCLRLPNIVGELVVVHEPYYVDIKNKMQHIWK